MVFVEKIKTKIAPHIAAIKARLAHSEVYTIVLPVFFTCLFLLTFVPFLFNNSALQFQIEQRISAALKTNFEIDGKVEVVFLPTPSITINDVILQNYNHEGKNYNFYAKEVTVKLSFLSSLMGEFAINKIIFSNALLQSYSSDNKPTEMPDKMTEIIAKKAATSVPKKEVKGGISGKIFVDLFKIDNLNLDNFNSANLPKISIERSTWISYDKFSNKKEVVAINADAQFSKKKIAAEGSFSNQDIVNNFSLIAKFEQKSDDDSDANNSVLELSSIYGNFKISGVFPSENIGFLKSKFKGKIEAEIFDLKNFYKSYVTPDGFIYNKINPAIKPIKLKASIVNNEEQIVISNIFVNSNIINGRGDIAVDLSTKLPLIDVKLSLENVDLDAIWLSDKEIAIAADEAKQNAETAEDKSATETAGESNGHNDAALKLDTVKKDLTLNLAKDIRDFDLTAELTVSRVKYLDEEIKNVNLYATISKQGEILILPLTLEVPGGGLFRMSGVLENYTTPKFIGSLDASGPKLSDIFKWFHIESQNLIYDNLKAYNLYSDIMLIPSSTILNNVYLNINGGQSELLGEMQIRYTSKSSEISSNFRVNSLTVDDYFLTSGQNIYLSPGSLLKKLLWLNNLTSSNDLSLSFDKLVYKNSTFNNQSIKMRFGQGYFEVSELKLNSDQIDLAASISVDISGSDPKFNMAVASKNFGYKSLENTISNSEDKTAPAQNKKITALDQFYALPSLEGFIGDVSFNVEKATFDEFVADNIKIAGNLKDGIMSFTNFSADIYNGNLAYNGVLGMKFDKAWSGNVTLTNASLKPLLSDLVGIKNIDGTANISASVGNSSSNKEEFFKNLTSSIKFSIAGVTVEGYGLNDLVKKMFNVKNYAEDLRDPEKILFAPNAITTFKQAVGTVTIDRGRDNIFQTDVETVAANGIVSGKIDLVRSSIDAAANIVFLTGTAKKQIPLNIATNLKGGFSNINHSTNLNQVNQYLGLPTAIPEAEPAKTNSSVSAPPQRQQSVLLPSATSEAPIDAKPQGTPPPNNSAPAPTNQQ